MTRTLALGAAILALAPSLALADSTRSTLTQNAWKDLGTGPIMAEALGGSACFVYRDAAPADTSTCDFILNAISQAPPHTFTTTQHVYARSFGDTATISFAPAISAGGGGAAADQTGTNATDGQANAANQQHGLAFEYIYNGVSWDRARGVNGVRYVLPQDVRSAPQTFPATAGSTLVVPLNGAGTLGLSFSGLAASGAVVTFSASNDGGTTYTAIGSFNAASGTASSTYAADGQTRLDVAGRTNVKLTVTTGGSGNITVGATASPAGNLVANTSPLVAQTATGKDIGAVEQFGAPWAVSWTGQTVGITGTVQLGAGSAAIGSVSVSNFPTTQQVSGTVAATQSGAYTVTQGPAGTAAWKVDGSAVTQPVSGTVAATEADGANVALGAKADAAAGTGNGSVIAQLKQLHLDSVGPSFGTYNSTAPTLANGAVGSLQLDVNGQLKAVVNPAAGSTWSTVDSNLVQTINSAGGVTSKKVSVERPDGSSLAGASGQVRATTFADVNSASVAANANSALVAHTLANPIFFSKFNAILTSSQTGTYYVQGSNDAFSSTAVTMATGSIGSSAAQIVTVPVIYTSYRAYIANGTTAATVNINTSYTAN